MRVCVCVGGGGGGGWAGRECARVRVHTQTVRARARSGPQHAPTPPVGAQVLGGNGYTNDYPTGRLLRDAKLYEIGAGTSEIRRMLIGRELYNEAAA